mmetsp:Transcript_36914/g.43127  ORF Transcript_36914/g.43127 Transcript_36914/m.43127 type:complete len:599 (-) Transcript_36914:345-2141(-)
MWVERKIIRDGRSNAPRRARTGLRAAVLRPIIGTASTYRSSVDSDASPASPPPPPCWYTFWMIGFVALCSFSFASSYSSFSAFGFSSRKLIASFTAASTAARSSASSLSFSLSLSLIWFRSEYAMLSSELRASTFSRILRSSSSNSAASRTIRSISSSLSRPLSFVIVISSRLFDALSIADTCRIEFSSTSNVTSICGVPRGAGGIPLSSNFPSSRLSFVICRSPSNTWISTPGWLSWYVENTWLFFVGICVLRSISFVITPPTVSMPSDSGITSTSTTLLPRSLSPVSTAPCTAAPYATASSGLIPLFGSLLKKSRISCCTFGIRVDPPTSTISSTSPFFSFASSSTLRTGSSVPLNSAMFSSSNFDRVIFSEKSNPSTRLSTSTRASGCDDSCRFAASHALRSRASAFWSLPISIPFFFFSPSTKCRIRLLSKSSPPRCVSPFVATTSKNPSSIVSSDTSNVPPPRSNTRMFFSPALFSPYAIAAAVGSLMIRTTFSPAIVPASFVDCRCASLKYAGTVTTAFFTFTPRYVSAISFIFCSTIALTSSGVNCFFFPPTSTCTRGFPSLSSTISNDSSALSFCTVSSRYLRPISRLIV